MPQIRKQTAKKKTVKKKVAKRKPKRGGNVIDRIAPVSETVGKDKYSIYGKSGTGKTALLSSFPKPMLIIGSERGTRTIRNVKDIEYVRLETSDELTPLIEYAEQKEFATVGLDTATNLQSMILAEILGLEELPTQASWGMASREQYGTSALRTKEWLRHILNLAERDISDVVILAQEREFDEDEDRSELIAPTIMPALTPSTVAWFNPECDFIFQTYKAPRTEMKEITVGSKKVRKKVTTSDVDYCLRVAAHPVYLTKFRTPDWDSIPKYLTNPTYDKISALM